MAKKISIIFILALFMITFIGAGNYGYNSLSKPTLFKNMINYTQVNVNNSIFWDGHSISDIANHPHQDVRTTASPTFDGLTITDHIHIFANLLFLGSADTSFIYSSSGTSIDLVPTDDSDVNIYGDLNVLGRARVQNSTTLTNYAVCYLNNGYFGHCTTSINATGGCTCAEN